MRAGALRHTTVALARQGAIPEEQPKKVSLILIYVVVFGALMIFMTTRGRKKQASQAQMMQQALAIGAEVRTIGGLVGTVIDLTDEYVIVETTPGVKLKFTKQAIAGVVPAELESETPEYGDELTPAEEEAAAQEESGATEPEDAVEGNAADADAADAADEKDQQKVG
jgi:preprotein translocase subunit YajC